MSHQAIATLARTPRGHVGLGKCCLDTRLACALWAWSRRAPSTSATSPPQRGDTRITDPRKRALPMALVALAIARAGRAAADLLGIGAPKRKAHGHFARSWFRTGFDPIRNLLGTGHRDALDAWRRIDETGPECSYLKGVALCGKAVIELSKPPFLSGS